MTPRNHDRVKFDQWMQNRVMPDLEEGETAFGYCINLSNFKWEKYVVHRAKRARGNLNTSLCKRGDDRDIFRPEILAFFVSEE